MAANNNKNNNNNRLITKLWYILPSIFLLEISNNLTLRFSIHSVDVEEALNLSSILPLNFLVWHSVNVGKGNWKSFMGGGRI